MLVIISMFAYMGLLGYVGGHKSNISPGVAHYTNKMKLVY